MAYACGVRKSELLNKYVASLEMIRGVLVLLTACVLNQQPEDFVFSRNAGTRKIEARAENSYNLATSAPQPTEAKHAIH